MLTEYQLYDKDRDEWYCTFLNSMEDRYWLAVYRNLFPSIDFEVRVKTYGD